jgi:uncharacterized protein YgiM (DUF1202 family)
MKDLYKALGLVAYESDIGVIRRAVRASGVHGASGEFVLLNLNRKKVYDRTHQTLCLIGDIRKDLCLNEGPFWKGEKYSDFKLKKSSAGRKGKEAHVEHARPSYFGAKTFIFGITALVVLLGIYEDHSSGGSSVGSSSDRARPPIISDAPPEARGLNFEGIAPVSRHEDSEAPREIWHVTAEALNLRKGPSTSFEVIKKLGRYDNVVLINDIDHDGWYEVRDFQGGVGYLSSSFVSLGDGELARHEACRSQGVSRPPNGSVLGRSGRGEHQLIVHNVPSMDSVVKLKNRSGDTVLSVYVRAGESVSINDVPEGEFQFQFATGRNYSLACSIFLDDMSASAEKGYNSYIMTKQYGAQYASVMTYTLRNVVGGNFRPRSISLEAF